LTSYLVKGDAVAIISEQGDWYRIEYKGKKLISGYLHKSDLFGLPWISKSHHSTPQ
ncbi:MAG: SH3 domain-containing protein, partial [Alphaproteobacteria bacterium]